MRMIKSSQSKLVSTLRHQQSGGPSQLNLRAQFGQLTPAFAVVSWGWLLPVTLAVAREVVATGVGIGLVLDLAITASRGDPVWGALRVPRPLRIAFIDEEQNTKQLGRSAARMAPVIGRPEQGNLIVLAGTKRPYEVTNPESLDALRGRLKEFHPDLVQPFGRVRGGRRGMDGEQLGLARLLRGWNGSDAKLANADLPKVA